MSSGNDFRGPWNEGKSTRLNEEFQFIVDPIKHVMDTNGLSDQTPVGAAMTEETAAEMDEALSKMRSTEVKSASPVENMSWNSPDYSRSVGDFGDTDSKFRETSSKTNGKN
jgi:Mn-containing catalase